MIKVHEYCLEDVISVSVKSSILELDLHLKTIEDHLLRLILSSQQGRLGINKIGNKIRADYDFNALLSKELDKNVMIKFFENRRSFHKIFIDNMYKIDSKKIINFLILGKELNKSGRIVDSTSISISEVDDELQKVFKVLKSKEKRIIRFIEIVNFDDYIISDNQGYSKYIKLNHA